MLFQSVFIARRHVSQTRALAKIIEWQKQLFDLLLFVESKWEIWIGLTRWLKHVNSSVYHSVVNLTRDPRLIGGSGLAPVEIIILRGYLSAVSNSGMSRVMGDRQNCMIIAIPRHVTSKTAMHNAYRFRFTFTTQKLAVSLFVAHCPVYKRSLLDGLSNHK